MKTKSFILAVLFACGIFLATFLKAETFPSNKQQKMYVAAEQINIDADCILISVSQEVFGTNHLSRDKKGYYVYANELYMPKGHLYRCPHRNCGYVTTSEKLYNYHIAEHRSGKHGREWHKRERGWQLF